MPTCQVVKFSVKRKDGGVVDAELLRPQSWVEASGLEVGKLLPINIEELRIEGSATVTTIEAAPAIAAGDYNLPQLRNWSVGQQRWDLGKHSGIKCHWRKVWAS